MKNILILGHTGFLGKNLTNFLENQPYNIFKLSRDVCDLRDYNSICKHLKDISEIDVIFNCAANVGSVHYVTEKAADVISDNSLISLNLYKFVLNYFPNATIVNPFSNCCYAEGDNIQEEENWLSGEVHESVFSFGNFKRVLYYISKCYNMQYDIKSINLMFSGIYGPGDSTNPNKVHALNGMIIRMLGAVENNDSEFEIWGTGKPIREWIYVEDVCKIMIDAVKNGQSIINPLNIAQGEGFSIAETAECISNSIGYDGKLTFNTDYQDGAPIKILGADNFKKVFNEYKFFNHQDGIDKTVEYYKEVL
tara:strand:- start:1069 stop:1992 length:924 start_codon:yes stop_codon:yes gene_type:complete